MESDSESVPPNAIESWPIDRPLAYARNARLHSAAQIEQLRASFRSFGQVWPILVRDDGTIIAGHGRLEAAKAEGLTAINVIVARGWTEERCRAFALLDNRVPLNATWDEELLRLELSDLNAAGFNVGTLGFGDKELGDLLGPIGETDPDTTPPVPEAPVSRAGDLWLLGEHRLLCGDSTKADDVARLFDGAKPHLMVTDPPYGVDYDPAWRADAGVNRNKKKMGKVQNDDRADWRAAWALYPGDVVYCWHAGSRAANVQASLEGSGFGIVSQIIWAKDRLALSRGDYHWQHEPCWYAVRLGKNHRWAGGRDKTTLWAIPAREDKGHGHGTQKPVECMRRPIENNSKSGDAVYDPFVGSGTTIIAAELTRRSCYAMELDPAYADVAVLRWQAFTGKAATLDGSGATFEAVAKERDTKKGPHQPGAAPLNAVDAVAL